MIRVGTSGWSYASWRGPFYPPELAQKRWLSYYAERFNTVELNATTYRLPLKSHIEAWCGAVDPGFSFTVKLSRLITHRKSLPARVDDFIANYMARIATFPAELIAQLLVQFPPLARARRRASRGVSRQAAHAPPVRRRVSPPVVVRGSRLRHPHASQHGPLLA